MSCSDVQMLTKATPWRIARKVSQTSTSFVSKIPTKTEPAGDAGTATGSSVIDLTDPLFGGVAQNGICFMFFGAGSDTNTGACRVIGWSKIITAPQGTFVDDNNTLWVPTVLAEFAYALSLQVGVANAVLTASDRFADTITLTGTTANAGVDVDVVSPANDTIGRVFLDLQGHQKVEFSFHTNSSSTNCNALYKLY